LRLYLTAKRQDFFITPLSGLYNKSNQYIYKQVLIFKIIKEKSQESNMNIKGKIPGQAARLVILTALGLQAFAAFSQSKPSSNKTDSLPSIAPWFSTAKPSKKTPNADGFIQRWMLLEPINKPNRTNTV